MDEERQSVGTGVGREYSTLSGWEADSDEPQEGRVVAVCYPDSVFDENLVKMGGDGVRKRAGRFIETGEANA